jgi:hypothetical protein
MAEVNGKQASPAPEGAPPSPTPGSGQQQQQPPPTQAAPPEQAPQYLTRDEALALIAERDKQWQQRYESLAKEQGQRGAQSYIDKRRLEERMRSTEATIQGLIRDGLLDESQASTYRERARTEALTDLLTEGPEQPQPEGGVSPEYNQAQAQMDQVAWTLINQAGLTDKDPEWQMLLGHNDFTTWHTALQTASAAKAARLARSNAQANAQPPAPATAAPVQPPPPTGAQAVEIGAGGSGQVTDRAELGKQMNEAARQGNRAEVERIRGLLRDLRAPG